MSDTEFIGYNYIMTLGTPFPNGTVLNYNGETETIVGFEFTMARGLVAITASGKKISDFDQIANAKRKRQIQEFFTSNETLKVQVRNTSPQTNSSSNNKIERNHQYADAR